VHKIQLHKDTVYVIQGSLKALTAWNQNANKNEDATLDIITVSKSAKSQSSAPLPQTAIMKVCIQNILDGLFAGGAIGNEDGLIQDVAFLPDQVLAMAAISYEYKGATSAVKFYSDRLISNGDGESKLKD